MIGLLLADERQLLLSTLLSRVFEALLRARTTAHNGNAQFKLSALFSLLSNALVSPVHCGFPLEEALGIVTYFLSPFVAESNGNAIRAGRLVENSP